jgi:hypothetical protein
MTRRATAQNIFHKDTTGFQRTREEKENCDLQPGHSGRRHSVSEDRQLTPTSRLFTWGKRRQ